jgi:hypothetical protein
LLEYEDLSYQEIASVLNCPVETVMPRLAKARKTLALCFLKRRSGSSGPEDFHASPSWLPAAIGLWFSRPQRWLAACETQERFSSTRLCLALMKKVKRFAYDAPQ